MHTTHDRRIGSLAFAGLVLLTLAPVVLQGIWRPMASALGVEVDSYGITCGSVAVAAVVLLTYAVTGSRAASRWAPVASGALVAALIGALLGRGLTAIAAWVALLWRSPIPGRQPA